MTPTCPRCGQTCPPQALLSPRQRQILRALARGVSRKAIADMLCISPKTVDTHYRHLCQRLELPHMHALIVYAVRQEYDPAAATD